jgi:hypothetical protein
MNPLLDDDVTVVRRPVYWTALRTALGRTPIWFFCWVVPLCLALILSVPWRGWFFRTLEHRYEPGSVLVQMDANFRVDHAESLEALGQGSAGVAAAMALVVMLFGAFSGGGWLQVFLERTQGHSMRRFLWGGARYFWRFTRVWILTLGLLAFLGWVLQGWPWKVLMHLLFGAEDGNLQVLSSESSALYVTWVQDGAYALAFALLLVWGDYTRARMAMQDTRSALWAGLCTAGMLMLHPVRSLRPMLLLGLFEFVVVWGIGVLSHDVNGSMSSGLGSVALLFVLGQAALLWQGILRGARYHAAAQVSRALVPPLAQPDPWASRVGGPGGPQYPIDMTDDYGVSI